MRSFDTDWAYCAWMPLCEEWRWQVVARQRDEFPYFAIIITGKLKVKESASCSLVIQTASHFLTSHFLFLTFSAVAFMDVS